MQDESGKSILQLF